MRLLILTACLMLNSALAAQGLSVEPGGVSPLRQAADRQSGTVDDGAPQHQNEWWRLTASLADRDGGLWGLEWTLFRQQPGPKGVGGAQPADPVSLAHVAITTPDGKYLQQQFAHGSMLRAGDDPRQAKHGIGRHPGDWEWVSQGAALFPARLSFTIGDRDLNLLLESTGAGDRAVDGTGPAQTPGANGRFGVRVRGFVDRGADKAYLRGEGRLERETQPPTLAEYPPGGDWLSLHRDRHGLIGNGAAPQGARFTD